MKKIIFIAIILVALGLAYWLILPLFINKQVNESLEDIMKQNQPSAETFTVESSVAPVAVTSTTPTATSTSATSTVKIEPVEPPKTKTSEPVQPELQIISQGNFQGADGFHKAQGSAKLIKIGDKYYVRFEDNFKVTNGPDLFVIFGNDGQYNGEARLGALKGNMGGQNYPVPPNINPTQYNEVWVWCRAFNVPFGKASLSR